ncbi:MAG: radical SAM protein [Chloroflexi bacterium]|nr:radical SAM protein [Chloroflexota bacterium]
MRQSIEYEDDCACASTPIIFSNVNPPVFYEEDCACSPSLSLTAENLPRKGLYHSAPALHKTPLDSSHQAVYNPLGNSPLAVMNDSALRLLEAFDAPTSLAEAVAKFSEFPPDEALNSAREMIALGIVQNVEQAGINLTRGAPADTLTAWLHLTNACNLRCDYCYLQKTRERMSLETGKKSVDAVLRSATAQAFKQVKLKYAGGESTLEFDLLLQLHDYAQSRSNALGLGLTGVVLSNGIGISGGMISALSARNLRLSISLDGLEEYHDAQRKFINGRGSFTQVERSLERLTRRNFKPSITVTVSQRNAEGLPQVVEYLLARELPFTINFYRANEHSAAFEDLAYQDEQIITAMKAAFAKIEGNLPPFSILGAITDRARLDVPHQQPCGVGDSYMVVDQNGNIAKCHAEINRSITDVTAVDPLKVLQIDQSGIQNVTVEEKEGCRACAWKYACAGGCPALTYRVTGRYDVQSPNCRIYKALFPEVLRLEGLRVLKYAAERAAGLASSLSEKSVSL